MRCGDMAGTEGWLFLCLPSTQAAGGSPFVEERLVLSCSRASVGCPASQQSQWLMFAFEHEHDGYPCEPHGFSGWTQLARLSLPIVPHRTPPTLEDNLPWSPWMTAWLTDSWIIYVTGYGYFLWPRAAG